MRPWLLTLTLILFGCSGLFNSEKTVSFSLDDPYLVIRNDTSYNIYYLAAEKEFEASMVWYPGFDQPTVKAGATRKVHFAYILNGEQEPVKKYDWIIIYWWTDDFTDLEDMHREEIQIK